MRTVEHQHRRARRLILALMHLQIGILDIQRQFQAFPLNRTGKRGRDIEI